MLAVPNVNYLFIALMREKWTRRMTNAGAVRHDTDLYLKLLWMHRVFDEWKNGMIN
jgi:hypothetical protein